MQDPVRPPKAGWSQESGGRVRAACAAECERPAPASCGCDSGGGAGKRDRVLLLGAGDECSCRCARACGDVCLDIWSKIVCVPECKNWPWLHGYG